MAVLVVDASAALAWCFEDEASSFTDGLLDRLRHGDQIVVPAHWPTEISNGLLVALRKKRIKAGQPELFWDELARLPQAEKSGKVSRPDFLPSVVALPNRPICLPASLILYSRES